MTRARRGATSTRGASNRTGADADAEGLDEISSGGAAATTALEIGAGRAMVGAGGALASAAVTAANPDVIRTGDAAIAAGTKAGMAVNDAGGALADGAVTTANPDVIRTGDAAITAGTVMIGARADVTSAGLEVVCACAAAAIGGEAETGATLDVIEAAAVNSGSGVAIVGGEIPRARVTAASRKMEGSGVTR